MKPVIFIPGIEATALVNANTFDFSSVWNAYNTLGSSIGTKILGPYLDEKLQINPLYDQKDLSLVERSNIARLPYEKSILNLTTKVAPDPVYLFGYDWRLSNLENGKRLAVYVDYLKNKLMPGGFESFRFLTHSMGVYVYLGFLQQRLDTHVPLGQDISAVVHCAPPFRGSLLALMNLVVGQSGLRGFFNKLLGRDEDIRKVIRTYPALFELLPWYDNAFTEKHSGRSLSLQDINDWQSNVYDDDVPLFQARLNGLATFRQSVDRVMTSMPALLLQNTVVIAGSSDDTVTHLTADETSNNPRMMIDFSAPVKSSGDGTVPLVSSTYYRDKVRTFVVPKNNLFDEPMEQLDFHALLLRDSRVQNIYSRFLTGDMASPTWYQSIGQQVTIA